MKIGVSIFGIMWILRTKAPVPHGFDWILKGHYGDYVKIPPMEQRINHEYLELDPEVPYNFYFARKLV